ncbi:MAG: transposase, partial [Burkholderiaceae bacterium]|nr:transposase [Burkholderiaceae bacterium]
RIKDKHAKVLCQLAREVNQVWNHVNEVSAKAARPYDGQPTYLSGYDLQKLTAGYSKCEGVSVGSGTVQLVCVDYATRRKQFKKTKLRWRVSNRKSSKYSLGWVPFKVGHVKYKAGQLQFAGHKLSLWDSYGLAKYDLRSGSFSEDSRGRWYFNVAVEVPELIGPQRPAPAVGIDLGLKDCATASDTQQVHGRWYREHELKLGKAQRAHQKKRVKAIHAKIKNQRKDALHKFSTAMVQQNAAIFVGDVASSKLVKTKMAKSTLDAGWSALKTMLDYKSQSAGIVFMEVNEAYTTAMNWSKTKNAKALAPCRRPQTCSCCGSIPASSPKGRAGLGIGNGRAVIARRGIAV